MPVSWQTCGSSGSGDQQLLPDPGQRAVRHAVDMHQRVVELRPGGDRAVAGHGPGRGGPDHHRRRRAVPATGASIDREAHPDRGAGVVVILDLGLGQRGLLDRRPHHRAQAAIQRAVQQELADLAGDRGFRRQVHGGVAVGPVALDAQAAELRRLHAHPVRRRRRGIRRGNPGPGRRPCPACLARYSSSIFHSIGRPWQSQPGM